jgi:hypothetical protein
MSAASCASECRLSQSAWHHTCAHGPCMRRSVCWLGRTSATVCMTACPTPALLMCEASMQQSECSAAAAAVCPFLRNTDAQAVCGLVCSAVQQVPHLQATADTAIYELCGAECGAQVGTDSPAQYGLSSSQRHPGVCCNMGSMHSCPASNPTPPTAHSPG